jgi:hypothetical protein
MSGLASAVIKFPLAVTTLAARKLVGALPLGDLGMGRAVQSNLYKTGEAAQRDLAPNAVLSGALQFTDAAQEALLAMATDALTLRILQPEYLRGAMSGLMRGGTGAIGTMATPNARDLLAWQLRNTCDAIALVNHTDAPAQLSPEGAWPLEELLDKAYSDGEYAAPWSIEGLGERYAEAHLRESTLVRDLLTSGPAAALPSRARLMMHAGMGHAFATDAVAKLTPWSDVTEFDDTLREFLDRCRANSMAGYVGAAIESLGFATRAWHKQMVSPLTRRLGEIDPAALEFFWHGAGRALNFQPLYMLPGLSPWLAAQQEPPDDVARHNARAGVAWAFTLVNIRRPEITANFLATRGEDVSGDDAFACGAWSALIMAGDTVPGHQYVGAYGRYQPDPANPAAVDAWHQHIGEDSLTRVNHYRDTLKAYGKLDEIFRYHALPKYVAELEAGEQEP